MKRMKKLIKAAAGFLSVLALTMLISVNVLAGQEEMAFVVVGVKGDEVISASPAYVINENGTYSVLGDISTVSSDAEGYVLANASDGKEYPLIFENKGISEINLAVFSFQGELPPDSQIALPGIVKNGQTVDMLYLDRELNPVSIKVKVTGAQDTGNAYLLLDMEAAEEVGEYLAPTLYLDDGGYMVAVGTSTGANAAFHTELAAFQGGSGGSGNDGNNGGGSDGSGGSDSSGTGDGLERSGPKPSASDPSPDSESWWKQHWLLLAAGIAGGIVVIIIAVRAASKSRNNSDSSVISSDDSIPDSPIADDFIPDSPRPPVPPVPVQPVPQPVPPAPQPVPQPAPLPGYQTSSATIIGTAGNMVNQVYTVTGSGLTFGRDASCLVRFPADVKGVSRIHCRLYVDGGGNLILTDCNATYGTHVKRYGTTKPIRLDANSSVYLHKGDKFYLGSNNISFQVQQAPGGKDM